MSLVPTGIIPFSDLGCFPLVVFRRMLSKVGTANKYIYNLLTNTDQSYM